MRIAKILEDRSLNIIFSKLKTTNLAPVELQKLERKKGTKNNEKTKSSALKKIKKTVLQQSNTVFLWRIPSRDIGRTGHLPDASGYSSLLF